MYAHESFLPPEISKFYVSESSFKDILGGVVGGTVRSVEVDGDEVSITVDDSFLKEIVGEKYHKGIESVEVDGDEVGITLSRQPEDEGETGYTEGEREYAIPP